MPPAYWPAARWRYGLAIARETAAALFQPWLTTVAPLAMMGFSRPDGEMLLWGFLISIPCLAVILLQAVAYEWPILENPLARFLGRISYSIYLWHIVAITAVGSLHLPASIESAAGIVAAVGVATLSHFAIERPGLRLAAKLQQGRARSAAAAV
jgi:peptidoglycan/LPS O-acetylase OafA/YrhL